MTLTRARNQMGGNARRVVSDCLRLTHTTMRKRIARSRSLPLIGTMSDVDELVTRRLQWIA